MRSMLLHAWNAASPISFKPRRLAKIYGANYPSAGFGQAVPPRWSGLGLLHHPRDHHGPRAQAVALAAKEWRRVDDLGTQASRLRNRTRRDRRHHRTKRGWQVDAAE